MNIIKTGKKILLGCALSLSLLVIAYAEPQIIRLQKDGKIIDLFGTMHLTKAEHFPLPTAVTTTLEQADILAVELDLTDIKTQFTLMKIMANITAEEGRTVKALLTANEYRQFQALLGDEAPKMETMKPWVVATMLTVLRAQKMGFSDKSVDETLINQAKSDNIPVQALEKVDEQLGIFDALPIDEEKQFLLSAMNDDFNKELKHMLAVWEDNDEASAQVLLQKMAEAPQLYQNIVTNRNQAMAKRIMILSRHNARVFVAIGALHLYGDDSVVELLLKAGYTER